MNNILSQLLNRKLIVVTGGAGFIGSCLVKRLNEYGVNQILLVDQLRQGEKWKNLVGKQFIDLLPKEVLFNWLKDRGEEIAAIIHLGACSSTLETNADYLLENNYRFSCRLAEYALQHGQRFIYASSAATYGDGSLAFSDDHERLEQYRPLNMYGFSKHLFDLWLKRHQLLERVVGLKYFNVYGPNETHKAAMASAVSKMVPEALASGRVRLFKSSEPDRFGDGEQVRDFIYVKDAVEMTLQFLTHSLGGIFNIGTGEEQTWNRLARAVIAALEQPITIEYIEMPASLLGKYQNYTRADMSKSAQFPLKRHQYSLEAGVKDYVQNYLLKQVGY